MAAVAAAALGLYTVAPSSAAVLSLAAWCPLKCPFYLLTGIPCPTCGLGRALLLAATGDWRLAWSYHPFGVLLIVAGVALALGYALKPHLPWHLWLKLAAASHAHPRLVAAAVIAYATWGFTRPVPF